MAINIGTRTALANEGTLFPLPHTLSTQLTEDKAVVGYAINDNAGTPPFGNSNFYLAIATNSGGTISVGSFISTGFYSNGPTTIHQPNIAIEAISDSKFLAFFPYNNAGTLQNVINLYSVSGTTITLVDSTTVGGTTWIGYRRIRKIDSSRALFTKSNYTTGVAAAFVVEVTGSSISGVGTPVSITNLGNAYATDAVIFTSTTAAIFGYDLTTGYVKIVRAIITSLSISLDSVQTITEFYSPTSTTKNWQGLCAYNVNGVDKLLMVFAYGEGTTGGVSYLPWEEEIIVEGAVVTIYSGSYNIGSVTTLYTATPTPTYDYCNICPFDGTVYEPWNLLLIDKNTTNNTYMLAIPLHFGNDGGGVIASQGILETLCVSGDTISVLDLSGSLYSCDLSLDIYGLCRMNDTDPSFLITAATDTSSVSCEEVYSVLATTTSVCSAGEHYVMGMSTSKFSGGYTYVTAWINDQIIIELWDNDTETFDSAYVLEDNVDLADVISGAYRAIPYAPSNSECYVFGYMTNPGDLGVCQIVFLDNFATDIEVFENSWGSDYCGSLVTDDYNEKVFAIRCNASSSKLYTGATSLSLIKTLPFSAPVNPHGMKLGSFEEVVIAAGGSGQTQTVVYALAPYTDFEDITYNHPQSNVKSVVIT